MLFKSLFYKHKVRNFIELLLFSMLMLFCVPALSQNSQAENVPDTNAQIFLDQDFKVDLNNRSQFTIAIMPMQNMSVDSEVAYHFRQRVAERLQASGYNLANMAKVDKSLYDLGVQNADQIRLLSFQQVTEQVKADAYIFGIIEQAKQQHAIAYNSYVYTSSLKMQDKTGKLLWSALQERVAKRRFALDPINAILDIFLVKSGGDKRDAIYALADKLLENLPQGPVEVTFTDPLFDQAEEVEATVSKTPDAKSADGTITDERTEKDNLQETTSNQW